MKRKITNLEQQLINNGWYLTTKTYSGKKSEKTFTYEYRKTIENDNCVIVLDKTRTSVVKFGIDNIYVDFLGKAALFDLHNRYLSLKDFVDTLTEEPKSELLESDE